MPDRDLGVPVVTGAHRDRLCRRLHWKQMFIDSERDPKIPSMADGFVWCTHTMNCLGPDGVVAGRDSCRSGRRCFER